MSNDIGLLVQMGILDIFTTEFAIHGEKDSEMI